MSVAWSHSRNYLVRWPQDYVVVLLNHLIDRGMRLVLLKLKLVSHLLIGRRIHGHLRTFAC